MDAHARLGECRESLWLADTVFGRATNQAGVEEVAQLWSVTQLEGRELCVAAKGVLAGSRQSGKIQPRSHAVVTAGACQFKDATEPSTGWRLK